MTQKKTAARILFVLYGLLMLWLLFFQSARIPDYGAASYWQQVKANLNLAPFHTVGSYWDLLTNREYYTEKFGFASIYEYQARQAFINLGGNVGMFAPLGFFLPWVFEKLRRLWKTLLTAVGIISLVELAQLFSLLGKCDVDDLILNAAGAAVGYGIWFVFRKIKE